jgi:hypothetical protein
MRISLSIAGVPFALLLYPASGSAAASEVGSIAPGEAQLGGGEQTDSGPSERVFLDADLGAAYVDMHALIGGALLDPARLRSNGFGLMCGAAFNVRLQEFTLAVRYRYGAFSDWQLWTLGVEASKNFSLGRIEPYFGFGAGYASLGGVRADTSRTATPNADPTVDIYGLNVRVNAGIRYYVSRWFSVGGNLSGEVYFLHREGDRLIRTLPTDPNAGAPFPYAMDGSGSGLGAALSVVLGVHY